MKMYKPATKEKPANLKVSQKHTGTFQCKGHEARTSYPPRPVQHKAHNTGLPDNLKAGIENLSGYSMDDVKVHYNSSKPAGLRALAYAQGNHIHLAPGQAKHLPHEAWHVVQQKQGRVKPTMQMKGSVEINDDKAFEREADEMGRKAANTDHLDTNSPFSFELAEQSQVTLNRDNNLLQLTPGTAMQPVVQCEGEETRSSQALKYGLIGARTGSHIGAYGAVAGALLGSAYGYLSGYSSYSNHQKLNYESELNKYNGWRIQRDESLSAYESGKIFTYSSSTADDIHALLSEGQAMYVYDTHNKLRVSGNHGNIKHAILAANSDVYAAGIVVMDDPVKNKLSEAINEAGYRNENMQNLIGLKDAGQVENFKATISEAEQKLITLGYTKDITLEDLTDQYNNHKVRKAQAKLDVNEDSGHYSPSYDSGHKALEAWRNAGYTNLSWKPRWQKKGWLQSTVQDINGS